MGVVFGRSSFCYIITLASCAWTIILTKQHRYVGGFQINLVPTPWKRIEQLHFNKRVENFDNHQIEIDSFH